MNRFDEIIRLYKDFYKKDPDSCIEFAKSQRTLSDAIRISALSINRKGNKHPHQYRVPKILLEEWYDALLIKINEIKNSKSFDELFSIMEGSSIKGIGELTVYDTANRIGAFMNLYPEKIYLHAGTLVGAKKILGNVSDKYLLKSDLPKEFQRKDLACWEIEDILCIFKHAFSKNINEPEFKTICRKASKIDC